jgi:hypothetical protein
MAVRAAKNVNVTVEMPMAMKKAHHGNVDPAKLLVIKPTTAEITHNNPNHQDL